MKLWKKMFLGLILGLILGVILREKAIYLESIGTAFLGLLSMVVGFLVFSSVVTGIVSINDMKKLGRVGIKSLILYIGTTAIAIVIGIIFAKLFNPASGFHLTSQEVHANSVAQIDGKTLLTFFTNIIPKNPFSSFVEGNILQIIVFSLFTGIALQLSGERGDPVKKFFISLNDVMIEMTKVVMLFAPYGICAIMAWVTGNFGLTVLIPLCKFLFVHYVACIVQIIVVFGLILRFLGKCKITTFLKAMADAIACAASTTSSSATLPITMSCARDKLGLSSEITNFVIPLGATINMNGTAIFQGLAAVFISQVYGIHLTFFNLIVIVLTATFSAIGSAGIPGAGIVTLSLVFSSVGLPIEGIVILAGIDRFRDIIGTVVNILGDAVVAVCVDKKEEKKFRVVKDYATLKEPVG